MTARGRGGDVDEIAMAAASARLDQLRARHPELIGAHGGQNINDWIKIIETNEKGSHVAKTPSDRSENEQLAFRFPKDLIARIDRYVTRLESEHPGLEFSRSDAVRTLLTRALDEIEGGTKRRAGKAGT